MKIFFVITGIISLIFLAGSLSAYNEGFLIKQGASGLNNDIFYKTFGEFKNFLSDTSYVEADVYYHGGIYDFHGNEKESGKCIAHKAHREKTDTARGRNTMSRKAKPSLNILPAVGEAMLITEHRHLKGDEEKEIIPWIYYAIKLNPHNETAYAVGGFWLAVQLKKPEKAITLLKQGIVNNPCSWEIYATLGQVYLVNKSDYKNAKIYLEKAKELIDKSKADKFDKMRVYSFLAEAYAKLGKTNKALEVYREILVFAPGDEAIKRKIKKLYPPSSQKEAEK